MHRLNSEYLERQNSALMILTVISMTKHKLIGVGMMWYKERWEQGMVMENDKAKHVLDSQFNLQKAETARHPT